MDLWKKIDRIELLKLCEVKGVHSRGSDEWVGVGKSGVFGSISRDHEQEEDNGAKASSMAHEGLCRRHGIIVGMDL